MATFVPFIRRSHPATPLRRAGLITFLLLLVLPSLACRKPKIEQCNVLFIVIDTLRADYVGCYGGGIKTPNIDSLAAGGVMFKNAFSHIPITEPSISSMFTGLLPVDHRVHNNGQLLDKSFLTLPEMMKQSGRQTAAFVSLGVLRPWFGLGEGFDVYSNDFPARGWRTAEEINAEVLPWLKQKGHSPFFLFVHYSDPHEPYKPPSRPFVQINVELNGKAIAAVPSDASRCNLDLLLEPGTNRLTFIAETRRKKKIFKFQSFTLSDSSVEMQFPVESGWLQKPKPTPRGRYVALPAEMLLINRRKKPLQVRLSGLWREQLTRAQVTRGYSEEVAYVDAELGKLLAALKEMEIRDRTMIVLVGDHGEGLGAHGLVGHVEQLYNTLLSVPCIMQFPRRVPAGKKIDAPIGLVNLYPTIAELFGQRAPADIRGRSLMSLITGREKSGDQAIYSVTFKPEARSDIQCVTFRGLKLIRNQTTSIEELYNLVDDPQEKNDIITSDKQAAAEGRTLLAKGLAGTAGAPVTAPKNAPLTAEELQQLEALGYVGDHTGSEPESEPEDDQ